jgi:hypothetical protein
MDLADRCGSKRLRFEVSIQSTYLATQFGFDQRNGNDWIVGWWCAFGKHAKCSRGPESAGAERQW